MSEIMAPGRTKFWEAFTILKNPSNLKMFHYTVNLGAILHHFPEYKYIVWSKAISSSGETEL